MADKIAVLVMVVMLGALALKAVAWQSGRAPTRIPERPTLAKPQLEETTAIDNDYGMPTGTNKLNGRIGVHHFAIQDHQVATPSPNFVNVHGL